MFSLSLQLVLAYLIWGILLEVRTGNRCSSTSPASLVIKPDFHSLASAKGLTCVIVLWLLVIYRSAVRQENSEDHSFLQKQLSWTSTTCVLHQFGFKFRSIWGFKRSFSFKLLSTRFSCRTYRNHAFLSLACNMEICEHCGNDSVVLLETKIEMIKLKIG